jgi:hypothetical protein
MSQAEVLAVLGKPEKIERRQRSEYWRYNLTGLSLMSDYVEVSFDEGGRVQSCHVID